MILTPENLIWLREKKCVLLDGSFDPLHAGHVGYFTEAIKAFPSYLKICAVASDDDIRAKGREPLFDQETRVAVVQAALGGGYAIAKNIPTEHLIGKLKPEAYVKGADWLDRLPAEQLVACSLNNVQIVYLNTVTDSSSKALRQWALRDAERGLDRLEAFMAAQGGPPAAFDADYFHGEWRADGNVYTYEKRKEIEGEHPRLIAECFKRLSILDVGCGPGYLVRMLKELGMDAGGCDPSPDAVALAADQTVVHIAAKHVPHGMADVVICREVLEHVPVIEIPELVCDLFRIARKFVYITTRFTERGVFDAETDFDTDPTHITCLSQPFLRSLCVLNGGKRRKDLEVKLDHQNKGRVLVYEVQ